MKTKALRILTAFLVIAAITGSALAATGSFSSKSVASLSSTTIFSTTLSSTSGTIGITVSTNSTGQQISAQLWKSGTLVDETVFPNNTLTTGTVSWTGLTSGTYTVKIANLDDATTKVTGSYYYYN